MFDCPEIFVATKKLTQLEEIDVVNDAVSVSYFHVLLNRHEVIFSKGAPTESPFFGDQVLNAMNADVQTEIRPILSVDALKAGRRIARPAPRKGSRIMRLLDRHLANKKPLVRQQPWRVLDATG